MRATSSSSRTGFDKEVVCSRGEPLDHAVLVTRSGHQQHWQGGRLGLRAQSLHDLGTGHPGHPHVEDDQGDRRGPHDVEGGLAIRRVEDVESATGSMLEGRIYHSATLLPGGRVLVVGGVDSVIDGGVALASAELYEAGAGSWSATESMLAARRGYTTTLLGDGTVLVAGGSGSDFGALVSAELFDPGTGG